MISTRADRNSERPSHELQSLLYEIIAGQTLGTDAASTSSARPSHLTTKSVGDFLPEIAPVSSNTLVLEENAVIGDELFKMQSKPNGENEESCSHTSSNRESWGRCSSLGSGTEPLADCTTSNNDRLMTLKVPATPLRSIQVKEEKKKKKKNKAATVATKTERETVIKRTGREKFEKLEALSQRLRLCILQRIKHKRNHLS